MKDVVVTGMGVVSSIGSTVDRYWESLTSGRIGIVKASAEDLGADRPGLWAPIDGGFGAEELLDDKVLAGTDRHTQMLMVAAENAREQAGLGELDPLRTALVTGTSMGGLNSVIDAQSAYEDGGAPAVPNKVQIKMWPNMGAAQLAYRWKLHGPQLTLCTACASSADAVGTAARLIESGIADVAVAGGSDAHLKPVVLLSAGGLGAGSAEVDPARGLLPFDKGRSGMVVGEGAGALVLESRRHAQARGARILAAVRGYGSLADSYHPSSPDPSGEWQALTMSNALADAGLERSDIAGIVAHGTGTRIGDAAELRAINRYLGEHAEKVVVASTKGHIGHTSGASAVMSMIAAIESLRTRRFVHNAGTTDPEDEARFRIVTGGPVELGEGAVQVNAFGFGGQNASVLLTRD